MPMLDGSIANSNLANSSITIDGSAISLGGSVTTNNTMGSGFVLEDADGTEVTITESKEVKFIGAGGLTINWTDTDNGTDGDPYDMTFTIGTLNQNTTGSAATLTTARNINGVAFDGSGNITVPAAGSTLTDTVTVAKGGTGATSFADKAVIITQDSGTDTLAAVAMSTNGQLLIGGSSGPAVATLTAGSNVTITNADGGITIAATDTDTNTTYSAGTLLDLSSTTL